ncbi:MAG: hypothetical protein U0744_13580 [Gemmataceae bacterium]
MFGFFRTLYGRVKAMFVREVALDLEADLLSRSADRHAEIERQARRYEQEGLPSVARYLRSQVQHLRSDRPLATILETANHLEEDIAAEASLTPKALAEVSSKAMVRAPRSRRAR